MRELLIVRHAVAQERDAQRFPDDDLRPLTPKGEKRFYKAARALPALCKPPEEVLTSSLTRAKQTARILERAARFPKARILEELRPERSSRDLIDALQRRSARRIAIVGHEPALSDLLSTLLGAEAHSVQTPMKKGGVAFLRFTGKVAAGKAVLVAFLPPRVLRSRVR